MKNLKCADKMMKKEDKKFQWLLNPNWHGIYQNTPVLLLALIIGVLGGYGAVLFRFIIKGVQFAFYQHSVDFL
ncbi:MAG: hypothetical protein ABFR31_13110, partial [Thermodesulfobacteriota bacterium]